MAGSVVVAAKKALIDLLADRAGLADVQISYAWPGDDAAEAERVFLGQARGQQEPASLKAGRTFRNENPEFDVLVQVVMPDGTAEEADTRALEIGLEVEETVADNKTLGGVPGLNWAVMARWELNYMYGGTGYLSEIVYTIAYNARLT
jgi:hypothetical protein